MDDADRSDERIALTIELGLRQARSAPALKPIGRCHFCDEATAPALLFCGLDCADDFQAEEEALKRLGRR